MDSKRQFVPEPYVYEPLPTPSSIRLVSVIRKRNTAPVESGTPLIECLIRTVDLDHYPAYKALSYTWGNPFGSKNQNPDKDKYSPKHTWPISINGRLLNVRLSLHEALNHLSTATSSEYPGLDIDKRLLKCFRKTKLIHVAEQGRVQDVLDCLKCGANVHMQDRFGETPLHYAAENGHLEVVQVLLRYGARTDVLDNTGRTPLACCQQRQRRQHQEVAQTLIDSESAEARFEKFEILGTDVWIDGLCIDQNNIQERNAQVALMARIYKTAISVRIWLGPEDKHTRQVYEALNKPPHDIAADRVSCEDLKAVGEFFSRSWFRRKWVIQEICLAGSLEMYCGRFALNTNTSVFASLRNNKTVHQVLYNASLEATNLFELRHWITSELARTRSYFGGAWTVPSEISLVGLIRLTWGFACTDPRDSIFALLGILAGTTQKKAMTVDYTRPTADVFTDAARHFLEGRKLFVEPLEGLTYTRQARDGLYPSLSQAIEGMPSWVPNFHLPMTSTRFWCDRFQACGKKNMTSQVLPSEHPRLLRVAGRFVDRVEEVSHSTVSGTRTERGFTYHVEADFAAWLEMLLRLDVQHKQICSRAEAWWRTLLLDDFSNEKPAAAKAKFKRFICVQIRRHSNPELVQTLLDRLHAHETRSELLPSRLEVEKFRDDALPPPPSRTPAKCGCGKYCRDRSHSQDDAYAAYHLNILSNELIRTEGGYIGLGAHPTQEGDQIWVLPGGRVPFVLRPVRSESDGATRYRLVGEAYIHGIMYGEVMDKRRFGKDKFLPIEIE